MNFDTFLTMSHISFVQEMTEFSFLGELFL